MKSNVLRFDYWFSFNYKRLRSILGWQLNEDVFHDTYLLLRKDLLFIDLPIIDFEPLFWGIYKRARLLLLCVWWWLYNGLQVSRI